VPERPRSRSLRELLPQPVQAVDTRPVAVGHTLQVAAADTRLLVVAGKLPEVAPSLVGMLLVPSVGRHTAAEVLLGKREEPSEGEPLLFPFLLCLQGSVFCL